MSYTTYLAHHGIKGQKWGIRRFQNYDGTRIKDPLANITKNYKIVKKIFKASDRFGGRPEYQQLSFKERFLNPAKARQVDANNRRANDFDRVKDKIDNLVDNVITRDTATADKIESLAMSVKKAGSVCAEDYEKNVDFYRTVAGLAEADRRTIKGWTKERIVEAYRQGPKNLADDGSYNSYDYCLVANGKNPNRVRSDYDKALSTLQDFSRKISDEALGNRAEKYISTSRDGGYAGAILEEYVTESALRSVGKTTNAIDYTSSAHLYTDNELKRMKSDLDKYSKEARSMLQGEEVSHSVIVNDDIYSYRSYLAHHGIKGQKWGVRRFQKADGSLTSAGAKRYGIKSAMSAGHKVGAGIVKAARGGIQKAKEAKARKAAEKLERQKKVWAKTRLGLTMNADKFTIEELREANNRLDERDRAARGLAEQVKRGVGYFQAIRDVAGAIKDTKDYIEDISGETERKKKAEDDLKYSRQVGKEERDHARMLEREKASAEREIEYKREKDKLDRESKEKIEKMKVKAKKDKDKDNDKKDDKDKKEKASKGDVVDEFDKSTSEVQQMVKEMYPDTYDYIQKRKKEKEKARKEVNLAIQKGKDFFHSDLSTYGSYLAHHGIKGQKWGVRRFQNEDGTLTKAGLRRNEKAEKFREKELKRYDKNIDRAIARGQTNTKQMYEKLADHLVKMTVDDIYNEHRAVRTKAIGKAVLAGVATTLASSVAGLPNIASIPMGVAIGKAASAGTRDKYRLEQIAHAVIFADDNALEHHGIRGQKWGIRRFQDEAGRLTSAGKKHAAELRDKVTSKLKINAKSMTFEVQGGGGGGSIDGWEDVSKEDEVTLNDQKASLVLFLNRGMMSEEEVKELADAFGYKFDDSLPMDVHLRRLTETVQKTSGSDLKEAMYNFQQTQRKKVSYSEGIANGVSAVVNALFSSNLAAVADPVIFVKDVISAEMAKSKAEKRKQGEPVDEETGLHLKQNTDVSREEDLKDVNPGWKNLATNTKHNCMCCTATYDMRRRGYDVTANEVQFGYDYGDVTRWYPDAKVERLDTVELERKYVHKYSEDSQKQYKQEVNEQLQKELVAQGDGARGNLMVTWDGGGGHSMAYEVVDGVAYIYDGQANMKMDTMNVVAVANNIQYARLDNVDFDPEKIKEVVH